MDRLGVGKGPHRLTVYPGCSVAGVRSVMLGAISLGCREDGALKGLGGAALFPFAGRGHLKETNASELNVFRS